MSDAKGRTRAQRIGRPPAGRVTRVDQVETARPSSGGHHPAEGHDGDAPGAPRNVGRQRPAGEGGAIDRIEGHESATFEPLPVVVVDRPNALGTGGPDGVTVPLD
jgi:hypothetical protein